MARPYESIRIFKSDLLERFTHVHPLTPLVFWTPAIAFIFWRCYAVHELSTLAILLFGALGFLVWTLSEYILHRFVFHYMPKSVAGEWLIYLFHGIHHEDPIDPTRLVMPPVAAVIIGIPVFMFYRMIFGPVYVEPFFAFFLIGYLVYDYTHYAVHHFTPRTRFGKMLKNNHMQHHFVSHEAKWGVSSPAWDHVFGTVTQRRRLHRDWRPRTIRT